MKQKKVIIASSIIAGVLVIYLGMSIYFMGHFYFGTKIGDIDVSGMTAAAAEEVLQKEYDEYQLIIQHRDGKTDCIVGDEIGLSLEWSITPQRYIARQKGYDWIVKLFQPDKFGKDGTVIWDEIKLKEKIASLSALESANQIPAIDAKLSEYDPEKGYSLVPSVPGTVVNLDAFTASIEASIASLDGILDMTEGDIYVSPVIKDDDETLLGVIAQLNKYLGTVITYQVGDKTQVLDASVFQPWLYVNENSEVCIKEEAVQEYVKGLASTYNTYSSAKKFMTSYNQEITITNSHYGWKVDNEAEKAAIIEQIKSGTVITRDLKYSSTANSHGPQDFGNSYVEINLTAQHLFVYVNGQKVVESDLISGNVSKGWDTPTGIWGLTYKTKNAVLRGDGYAQPVSYWMPFAGNVGMHDATYKSDFGGNYYKTKGSHGCINLPLASAKAIYGYIRQNFPVIVYKLAGTESEKGIAMDQANAMDRAINGIGTVTLQSESKIVACRAQYDALSSMAKKYVKKYEVLVNAEKELEKLKNPVTQETP